MSCSFVDEWGALQQGLDVSRVLSRGVLLRCVKQDPERLQPVEHPLEEFNRLSGQRLALTAAESHDFRAALKEAVDICQDSGSFLGELEWTGGSSAQVRWHPVCVDQVRS